MKTAFFVTSNRISPVVALIDADAWPARSNLRKSCRAGILIGARDTTDAERKVSDAAPRHLAYRWPILGWMLLTERRCGRDWVRSLIRRIRSNRRAVDRLLAKAAKKTRNGGRTA